MSGTAYRIGEVARLLNLKTYVLRFWETEFPQLEPDRAESGQRLYTEENIELLKQIRYMLHEQGLTIEGARKVLAEQQVPKEDTFDSQPTEQQTQSESTEAMRMVRLTISELQALRAMLRSVDTERH